MANFDVNTDGAIKLTAKLEKLHRSAFPVAVRGTLNDTAFKTKSLVPKVAKSKFTTRQKSFFRAFSTVDKAKGFDLRSMKATTGINSRKGSKVAEGLEKQEFGGNIQGRKLIPMDTSRTSNSHDKKVRRKHRFDRLGKTIRIRGRGNRGTRKSRLVARVMVANRLGASHFITNRGGKGTLFEIDSVRQNIRTKKIKFKLTPLYRYRKSRISSVTKKPFMQPSAKLASKQMLNFYKKNAEKQFHRLLRK
ncbi:hypothetical protein [Christiangramia sp.]|uniref:hypothetical protein n=1 Tax=Christiangramia sp. TaxID=1931228 RepID=UPI0026034381|nr:hypothetical protein [Christiangramia sp.]